MPAPSPILSRIEKLSVRDASGCWLWTGYVNPRGYGMVHYNGRPRLAYRILFEIVKGPVPSGLQLDHLCRVTRCINPDHLEPVTPKENVRRSDVPRLAAIRNGAERTHCLRGHELVGDNLIVDNRGYRGCRSCKAERQRVRRAGVRDLPGAKIIEDSITQVRK